MGIFGFSTIKTTFEEVKMTSRKTVACSKCKKKIRRQQTFFQTMNPYNKNKDGIPKNRNEIYMELESGIREWRGIEELCSSCLEQSKG